HSPTSTPGCPASAASRARRAPAPPSSRGTPSTSAGRPTRWPTGPSRTSGATSWTTTFRTTSCTTGATPRSAAPTARAPAPTGTGAGRVRARSSAACTPKLQNMDVLTAVDDDRIGSDLQTGHQFWIDLVDPSDEDVD